MKLKHLVLVPVLVSVPLLAGCNGKKNADNPTINTSSTPSATATASGGGSVEAGDVSVSIKGFAFAPISFSIHKGKKITFTNEDSTAHTATLSAGAPEAFDSASIAQGKSATFTPMTTGTYHYVCTFHASMKASFTVVD